MISSLLSVTKIIKSNARRAATHMHRRRQQYVHTEKEMAAKGITLPAYQDAVWSYVKAQRDGNKLYIGDHVGQDETATTVRGKVGEGPDAQVSPEEAEKLAGQAALRLLSTISHYCDGDLDKVDQMIKKLILLLVKELLSLLELEHHERSMLI